MSIKAFIVGFFLPILLLASSFTLAKHPKTLLVLDMRNGGESLPKHFRTTNDFVSANINTIGFKDLHLIGSGQFSKSGFENALQHVNSKTIMVVDLRQESHGMLNGNAISWYGPRNADNAKISPTQIEIKQNKLLEMLAKKKEITVYNILRKSSDEMIAKTKAIDFAVHSVISEQEFIEKENLKYRRLFIQDFHAPNDAEVEQFVQLINQIDPNTWVYFHCRAGVGRTSTFMVMTDMLRNAKNVSFEDILARQVAIGGKNLSDMPEAKSYKYKLSIARFEFLKKFYLYAQSHQEDPELIWSDWIKN